MDKLVMLEIIDPDIYEPYEDNHMGSYLVRNPDENKIIEFQEMLNNRFDSDWWDGTFDAVDKYINENFDVINIDDTIEIKW